MAAKLEIPKPLASGATDFPDAPQSGTPQPPPMPEGYSDTPPEEAKAPPMPEGYSDTPSVYKEPEPGMLDKADTAITGALSSKAGEGTGTAMAKTLGRELYSGAKTIAGTPGAVVGAFTEPPQTDEEKKTAEQSPYLGRAATGIARLVGDPLKNAAQWYKSAYQGKVPDPVGQALSVAPEAIGAGAATEVAGKALPAALKEYGGSVVPKEGLRPLGEAIKGDESFVGRQPSPEVQAAKTNLETLQKGAKPLVDKVSKAQEAHDTYHASRTAGVPVPEKIATDLENAKQAYMDHMKHVDLAEQHYNNAKAGRPSVPNNAEPAAALSTANTPEAQPAAKTGEALATVPAPPQSGALESVPTPKSLGAAQTGEALGGSAIRNPIGDIKTIHATPAAESGEALGSIPANKSGELGDVVSPKAQRASESGEALGTVSKAPEAPKPVTAPTERDATGLNKPHAGEDFGKVTPPKKTESPLGKASVERDATRQNVPYAGEEEKPAPKDKAPKDEEITPEKVKSSPGTSMDKAAKAEPKEEVKAEPKEETEEETNKRLNDAMKKASGEPEKQAPVTEDDKYFQQAKEEKPKGTVGDWSKRAQELKTQAPTERQPLPPYKRPEPFSSTEGANDTVKNAIDKELTAPQRRSTDPNYVRPKPFENTEGAHETIKNDKDLKEFYRRESDVKPTEETAKEEPKTEEPKKEAAKEETKANPQDNKSIAKVFRKNADLLESEGADPFRLRAYRNAAEAIENHPEEISKLIKEDPKRVSEIPGIGKSMLATLHEMLKDKDAESSMEVHPEVKEQLAKHGNESLKELGKKYGLDEKDYDFKKREALREGGSKHPVDRIRFVNELMKRIPEEDKLSLEKKIKDDEGSEDFADRDQSQLAKRDRAEEYFSHLRKK